MKLFISFVFLFFITANSYSQIKKQGKLVVQTLLAKSIEGNHGGENPMRSITIYLPPGYDESQQRYPVIYFLHGFGLSDSQMVMLTQFNLLLDDAINSGRLRPLIVVFPNSCTIYKGSFYTNSSLTGNWCDYIAKDVVDYVDQQYRTIAKRESRGLAGHSMGGHGTLKIAMFYPDRFGALYALSPALLKLEIGTDSLLGPAFKKVGTIKNPIEAFEGIQAPMGSLEWRKAFVNLLSVSLARAYTPDEKNLPFEADFPLTFENGEEVKHSDLIKKWNEQSPYNMIDSHIDALKKYVAIKIDWGNHDQNKEIPVSSLLFSKKLESLGIKNFAEEYEGDHINKISGASGRIATQLLPFFNQYLKFE